MVPAVPNGPRAAEIVAGRAGAPGRALGTVVDGSPAVSLLPGVAEAVLVPALDEVAAVLIVVTIPRDGVAGRPVGGVDEVEAGEALVAGGGWSPGLPPAVAAMEVGVHRLPRPGTGGRPRVRD